MANFRLANAVQQAACDAVVDFVDAGAGAGYLEIYSTPQPATANDTATGTLLATLTFADPAFGAANTSGVASLDSAMTGDTSADATGTAVWARILTSVGATVFDCDVNTTGATINFDSVSFVVGGSVDITSFTITHPDGV